MSLFAELKRRNVVKVSLAYLALGWVVIEVTSTITPLLNLPEWLPVVVLWIGIIGFPFVAVFSWVYELTPEGLKRDSEISGMIAASLVGDLNRAEAERAQQRGTGDLEAWSLYQLGLQSADPYTREGFAAARSISAGLRALRQAGLE